MTTKTSKSLESRIRALEEIEAIKRLKYEYCFTLDKRDWKGVARLFAKDGVADYGSIGKRRGRTEIAKFFENVISKDFTFFCHMVHNPLINVRGNKATGKWYAETPATFASDKARWITGWYEDKYIKEDGVWKFLSTKSFYFYISSYEKGWGKERFLTETTPDSSSE